MNVIFLDIDGVMNHQLFYEARHKKRWFKLRTYTWRIRKWYKFVINGFEHRGVSLANFKIPDSHYEYPYQIKRIKSETDPLRWKWLSDFCNKTDTKICISSTWKHHFRIKRSQSNREESNKVNDERWEKALVELGFKPKTFVGITGDRKTLRGQEIKDWLDKHPQVKDFAIIDDDSDMLPEQMNNFFWSDPYCGITPTTIYKIGRHFKKLTKYGHYN